MKNTKIGFLAVVTIAIISFVYSGVSANKQISQRESDYAIYTNTKNSIQTGQNLEQSIKDLEKLQKKYNESYVLDIDKAIAYNNLKKYDKSLELLEEAFDKNKALYKNVSLLIAYAETANLSGDKEKAKDAILKAQEVGIPQEYQESVDKLLSEIE